MRRLLLLAAILASGALVPRGIALPLRSGETALPPVPRVHGASDEGLLAIRKFQLPAGLRAELVAAEPLLANPVAFTIDEKGRFFVAETFRHTDGVPDTRGHMGWLDDDLACRTVRDRVAMYRKHLGKDFENLAIEEDRVRLLEDTDGDGRLDRATVFAGGFRRPEDGIGAGLLARDGSLLYACIPDLWLLRDADGDGRADQRVSLHHGYGVHVGFIGHDLHGLILGPDGRLYFSIGDRGLEVRSGGRAVSNPDSGAVLRCEPDGSSLEIFATGLRNPQELAFDELGELFTGDNNSDSGDKARWVHLVEGSDSGWRIGYQFIEEPVARGPWNGERLWHPAFEGQAAYILPPVANLADGPSGLAHYPGLGLPEKYQGAFFLVDFRGVSSLSGIRSFHLKPRGASFELVDEEKFLWNVLATDADFGPDGCLYLTDWVEGWDKPGKGRIYRVSDPELARSAPVVEARGLIASGMKERANEELSRLLAHPHQRVRQEAQIELANRSRGSEGKEAVAILVAAAREGKERLARIHALWGLGQAARYRRSPALLEPLVGLLGDPDGELRVQAARVLGEARLPAALDGLLRLLSDPLPRARLHGALAIGKLARAEALPAVLAMLRENRDRDPFLRHAGVMALAAIADPRALRAAAGDDSPAVRMACLLALRRHRSEDVARFLEDPEARIALEAARAIYDVPIEEGMASLAAAEVRASLPEERAAHQARRLCANHRLGGEASASRVVDFLRGQEGPAWVRTIALRLLRDWDRPRGRDPLLGLWRPPAPRPAGRALAAIRPAALDLLRKEQGGKEDVPVRVEAIRLLGGLRIVEAIAPIDAIAADRAEEGVVARAALLALEDLAAPGLRAAIDRAAADPRPEPRAAALRILARVDPERAAPLLDAALESGGVMEKQEVLAALGSLKSPAAEGPLRRWLDRLLDGKVPAELQLDLLEAAAARGTAPLAERIARYEATRNPEDRLSLYREAVAGGDAERGRKIFEQKTAVTCTRCHRVQTVGGEVGPDLSGIGARQNREYILEAIVEPSRKIAQGFETVVLVQKDGTVTVGVLRSEDEAAIRLMTAEGETRVVPKPSVQTRASGPSAMPDDLVRALTKSEVRDLVAYLASLTVK